MRSKLILIFIIILAGCQSGCNESAKGEHVLIVSAAASLKDVFGEIGDLYRQRTDREVTFNFGASGSLQRQIEAGASVDVFASAGTKQMDALAFRELILIETRVDFAQNELVLIVPENSATVIDSFEGLKRPEIGRVAIGNPATVPAGEYAKQVFRFMNADAGFQNKLIYAEDVRQVLSYVLRGEVDAGIVYKTDIASTPGIKTVAQAPAGSHEPIRYPVAVIAGSDQKQAAGSFIDVLLSPAGQAIAAKYGLSPAATR